MANRFYQNSQQIYAEIRPRRVEFIHAEGRTDKHDKADTFYNLQNTTKMNVLDLKIIYCYYESNQQDATIEVNLLFLVSSTCFERCFRPSSGALDCIYSIW